MAVTCLLLSWSVSLADTTVVKVTKEDFPYDQTTRIFVYKDAVYLGCIDEYLEHGTEIVDPDGLAASLSKLLEWIILNKDVKANVEKFISLNDYTAEGYIFDGAWALFKGDDSGYGSATIAVGTACALDEDDLKELIEGLKNNLERARAEETQNKEDLFK